MDPRCAMDILKPYLMLASVAFTLGFAGYFALNWPAAPLTAPSEAFQATVSTPAPPEVLARSRTI